MNKRIKILALVAVYNRAELTMRCIATLVKMAEGLSHVIEMDICVVDDESTDGTVRLLKQHFGGIDVITTGGGMFWAGAMRLGFQHRWSARYDALLVLNDDTFFFDHALDEIVNTAIEEGAFSDEAEPKVVVGPICYTNAPLNVSYGGQVKRANIFRPSFERLGPNGELQHCDTLNMNFALINARCIEALGFLSPDFQHSLADFDYGMSVSRMGGSVLLTRSFLGSCDRNTVENTWRDTELNFFERYALLKSPKGMPLKERFAFIRRHFVFSNYVSLLIPYIILLKDQFFRYRKK